MNRRVRVAAAVLSAITLASHAPAQRGDGRVPPSALVQKCGTQIPWTDSLEAALAEAAKRNRPVFWYVATTPGSPMDRKNVVDLYMKAGPFSMPDVVSLITRRTVPLAAKVAGRGVPQEFRAKLKSLGIEPISFIEPGFLLLKPDGTPILKVDRVTTFHELWFTALLDRALRAAGDLGRPSDEAAAAKAPLDAAEAHLLDGCIERAAEALKRASGDADAKRLAYLSGRLYARMGDAKAAKDELAKAGTREAQVELALTALREDDGAAAEAILRKIDGGARADEARYLLGVAQHRQNRAPDAHATWKRLADASPQSPFAWRAAAEVERYAPFQRGFEEYGYLPQDAVLDAPPGTQRPRDPKDLPWMAKKSVDYLLRRQNPDGSWDDSNYDFGGPGSLVDVYAAVTAIAGTALLDWRDAAPQPVDAAVKRAFDFVSDEAHIAKKNEQERMWAHGYRALFLCKMLDKKAGDAAAVRAKLQEIVKLMEGAQKKSGIWAHEYPNPFVSAFAIQVLKEAEKHGAHVNGAAMKQGEAALSKTRGEDGTFSYGFPGHGDSEVFSAGRSPLCELARVLMGTSDQAALTKAVEKSFANHDAYEAVRKYDDHAPPHRIGGFFFWYDMMGRCDAIDALTDAVRRAAFFEAQRKLIAAIGEIDGRFTDSHELGKVYGTAAALICIKKCEPATP